MKKLIFSIISFLCIWLISWSIVHAIPNPYHPANPTVYSGVSNVAPPVMTGTMGGNSVYTVPTQNGLCYFIDQTRMLISGQTSFHNRGFGTATYLNAGVTRTWYNRITDRLEIAQQNDIPFHSLAGRDYYDSASDCTSYILFSEDFTDAAWTKTRAGITLYGTDPMGGEKAMFFREDGTAASTHYLDQLFGAAVFANNEMATLSLFAQADSRDWVRLMFKTKDNSEPWAWFNVSTGVIGTISGVSSARISQNTFNGFYRISISANIESAAQAPQAFINFGDDDNSKTYNGDANSGMTIFGAMFTETSWLAPYFATEASASLYTTSSGEPNFAVPQGILAETLGSEFHTTSNAASDPNGNETGVTSGWTHEHLDSGNSFYASDTIFNVGTHSLAANSNITPAIGAKMYKDIGTDWSLVAGETYKLTFDARHHGIGGEWKINLGPSESSTAHSIVTLTNADTTFISYTYYFVYDGTYRFLNCREYDDNSGGAYLDNLSFTRVTNARTSTITDGKMPPHGTMMFYAIPLFDADDMDSWCGLFNFDGATGTTGFYISSSGRYALGDGVNVAYGHASSGVSAWETSKVVGQWRVNSNINQMRVGVDRGEGLLWGSWTDYDGAFPEVLFSVFEEGWGRVLLGGPWMWNRILTDDPDEIYHMGGSP